MDNIFINTQALFRGGTASFGNIFSLMTKILYHNNSILTCYAPNGCIIYASAEKDNYSGLEITNIVFYN